VVVTDVVVHVPELVTSPVNIFVPASALSVKVPELLVVVATVRLNVEFVKLRVALITNELQVAATLIVQVPFIIALVPAPGTPALQFAAVLQLPVPVNVLCPNPLNPFSSNKKNSMYLKVFIIFCVKTEKKEVK
jgi:hypothetical protein